MKRIVAVCGFALLILSCEANYGGSSHKAEGKFTYDSLDRLGEERLFFEGRSLRVIYSYDPNGNIREVRRVTHAETAP